MGGIILQLNLQLSFLYKPFLVQNGPYWKPEKRYSILQLKPMAGCFTTSETH